MIRWRDKTMLVLLLYGSSCIIFFFFKQKTAYEMRISDWSSDVCSSDLARRKPGQRARRLAGRRDGADADHARNLGDVVGAPRPRCGPVRCALEHPCRCRLSSRDVGSIPRCPADARVLSCRAGPRPRLSVTPAPPMSAVGHVGTGRGMCWE